MTPRPRHPRLPSPRSSRAGFTLVELIVATVILAMVAGAATLTVVQSMKARERASAAGDAASRANIAVQRIAADAVMAIRDSDLTLGKVAITRGGPAGAAASGLMLFTHQDRPTRGGVENPESDEYEVQYRLEPLETAAPPAAGSPALFTLWRRSDPVPDEFVDAGGVAAPVVDGLVSLVIDAYDGTTWRTDWDSDADGYPHAIRITATASDDNARRTITARRVVAFDRVPLPPAEEEEEEEATDTSAGGTG
ncbi:MAG: prepilin-type N-terminal cleavage/methylation domain-containing protein [Phycisphaerales bacterium]|nr:prepilin-type N-terminal cleavage/methylation domain-containing protein [Phycisphaerales bacterium]